MGFGIMDVVVIHNLKGYDSHLIVQKIDKLSNVSVVAKGMEKYIKIIGKLKYVSFQFIDSYQFLATSLERLVNNLEESDFKFTNKHFKDKSHLFKKKGVYPYDYMNNWQKFNQDVKPTQSDFYDTLKQAECSNEDYRMFNETYDVLKCQNMGDYHDAYLYSDVTLLADVFEKFRSILMSTLWPLSESLLKMQC